MMSFSWNHCSNVCFENIGFSISDWMLVLENLSCESLVLDSIFLEGEDIIRFSDTPNIPVCSELKTLVLMNYGERRNYTRDPPHTVFFNQKFPVLQELQIAGSFKWDAIFCLTQQAPSLKTLRVTYNSNDTEWNTNLLDEDNILTLISNFNHLTFLQVFQIDLWTIRNVIPEEEMEPCPSTFKELRSLSCKIRKAFSAMNIFTLCFAAVWVMKKHRLDLTPHFLAMDGLEKAHDQFEAFSKQSPMEKD
jgi:hypothetical protein